MSSDPLPLEQVTSPLKIRSRLLDAELWLVPEGYATLSPFLLNLTENVAAVQFNHRLLGVVTGALAIALCAAYRGAPLPRRTRVALYHVAAMGLIQPALGITALVLVVPIPLALLQDRKSTRLNSSHT